MADVYTINVEGQRVPQDPETTEKIEQIIKFWTFTRQLRYNFEVQCQEAALLIWPEWANTFFYGYDQWPGQKKTMQQVDSSGMLANERFAAIVDSNVTPMTSMWSRQRAKDVSLRKKRRVKQYFDKLNAALWDARYATYANFQGQSNQNYRATGAFGSMYMFVDALASRYTQGVTGLRYRSVPWGEVYLIQNHQGLVDGYFRAFRRSARQIWQEWPDTFPEVLKAPLEQGSQQLFWILQYVCPRADGSAVPWRMDAKGMLWASYYISIEGHVLLDEGGYHSWPLPVGRYTQAPDEVYGRGPAFQVLPTLKTLNAEETIFLTQGHRASSPIYLTYDDTINFKSHPGAWNPGGLNKDGKRLIDILPTGDIQITQEMKTEHRNIIKDAFLVNLFQLAWENPNAQQMSARQVVEFINDRGMLMAPTLGRLHSEYLGPMIHRELSVLAYSDIGKPPDRRVLPEIPPELKEAGAEYETEWTSPLMRAMRASKTAGYMRLAEQLGQLSQQTGDPSVTDIITLGIRRAAPAMACNEDVDTDWLATDEELDAKVKERAQQAEREARAKELPAEAAIMKAKAISDKAGAGQNTGGTLSGTPEGGMPQIPGNPPGQPGQPSMVPGQPGLPGQPPRGP